jgi:hypothetical protein
MSTLTNEQKEIIERKRQLALQRRNERQRLQNQHLSCASANNSSHTFPNAREGLPASQSQQISSITSSVRDNSIGLKHSSKQAHEKAQIDFRQFVRRRNTSLPAGEVVIGNSQLLSKERFSVTVPYQEQLIDIFKSIDSSMYGKLCFCTTICRELVSCHVILVYLGLFLQNG